jgi:hypothetical protein
MKKVLTLSAAAALVAAVAVPVAIAASTTGTSHGTVLTASASPSKSGTKRKPKAVKIHTLFTSQPPAQGQPAYATTRTIVHLPKGLIFNGAKFKECSADTLNASGPTACPTASKVGSGSAQGNALGQTENLTVTAFNGAKGKQLLLYVQGSSPLSINSTIVGTVKKDTGKYGYKLDVAIPANLQQPLTGVYATLTRFDTTIGAKKGKLGYVESTKCSKKTWNWGADLTFTDGTSDQTTTTSSCS